MDCPDSLIVIPQKIKKRSNFWRDNERFLDGKCLNENCSPSQRFLHDNNIECNNEREAKEKEHFDELYIPVMGFGCGLLSRNSVKDNDSDEAKLGFWDIFNHELNLT